MSEVKAATATTTAMTTTVATTTTTTTVEVTNHFRFPLEVGVSLTNLGVNKQ